MESFINPGPGFGHYSRLCRVFVSHVISLYDVDFSPNVVCVSLHDEHGWYKQHGSQDKQARVQNI